MKNRGGKFHYLLSDNIVFYRKKKGLTQEMLASKMDTNRTYINWLESGKANPTLEIMLRLARNLEIEPSCLLEQ